MIAKQNRICMVALGLGFLVLGFGCVTAGSRSDAAAALVEQGQLALARGRIADADRAFARVLAVEPENRNALLGMARTRYTQGDPEAALYYFDRHAALPITEEWVPRAHWDYCAALVMSVESALERGDLTRATEQVSALQFRNCDDERQPQLLARVQVALADREREAGWPERALEIFRALLAAPRESIPGPQGESPSSVETDPSLDRARADAYQGAVALLRGSGRRSEAIELLDAGLVEFPRNRALVLLMLELLIENPRTR